MPLHVRSIATNIAVVSFFGLSLAGWAGGISPFTCCKRALGGAAIAYIAAVCVVKIINAILISAMINSLTNKQKEQAGAGKD